MINIASRTISLNCRRFAPSRIDCELKDSSLFGTTVEQIPQLRGAKVVPSTSAKRKYFDVVLLSERGDFPLPTNYTLSKDADREIRSATASRINGFVANSQPASLTIQENQTWFPLVLGCIFLALGLAPLVWLILLARRGTATHKS